MMIDAALYEFSDDRAAIVLAACERLDAAMSDIRDAIEPKAFPDLYAGLGQMQAMANFAGYFGLNVCCNHPGDCGQPAGFLSGFGAAFGAGFGRFGL